MAPPNNSSFVRASLGGLSLGLFGAALIFVGSAWTNVHHDCDYPGTDECAFEVHTGEEIGRIQAWAAIGCALVSSGLFLASRRA